MTTITIREFRNNIKKYMSELPVDISVRGKVVATVIVPEGRKRAIVIDRSETIAEKEKIISKKLPEVTIPKVKTKYKVNDLYSPVTGRCEHGCYQGYCLECDGLLK